MVSNFEPLQYVQKLDGDARKLYLAPEKAIQWFLHEHPDGRIITHMESAEPPIFRAEVWVGDQLMATGYANPDGNTKTFRKVETAAIRRALAHAGYDAFGAAIRSGVKPDTGEIIGNQPISAVCTKIDVRVTDKGKPYLSLNCATEDKSYTVSEFSRDKFIKAGWCQNGDWTTAGDYIKPQPFIPVVITKSGTYWNLLSVGAKTIEAPADASH